jgi:hypothetical protein
MTMRVRVLLSSVFVVAAAMWLVGCGHYICHSTFGNATCTPSGGGISQGGGGSSGLNAFAYFVDDDFVDMAVDSLSSSNSGAFTPLSSFVSPTLPAGPLTDGGAVVVNNTYMYIPFQNGQVYGFSMDASGALTPVPNSPYAGAGGYSVAADPTGRFLFVGSFSGSIFVFTISATDGSLTLTGSYPSSIAPVQMVTDGQGKFLYAVQGFPGSPIAAFSYDQSTGALIKVPGSPFSFSPNVAMISGEASGKYLVGITGGVTDNHIYLLNIAQSGTVGALSVAAGSPFSTVYTPISLAVSPNGAFIYTFNEDALGNLDPVEGYLLSSSLLSPISGSPFASLKANFGSFDQSGKVLAAVALNTGTSTGTGIFPYTADPSSGALSNTAPAAFYPNKGAFVFTDAP